jgi:hypothetical protein
MRTRWAERQFNTGEDIRMKHAAIAAIIFATWWFYVWRHDPVEGAYMRPFAIVVGGVGILAYFEGLKREIVAALQSQQSES